MKDRFGKVKAKAMHDPELSLRAKGLYAILATYADKDGKCYPKIETLVKKAGVDERTIYRIAKELQEKGYVKREKRTFELR